MVKESEACVTAAVAAASALAAAALAAAASITAGAKAQMSTEEEDDITGEVPLKVMSITLRFAGLPQKQIVRIFPNKFKPINFYRLRYMFGLRFDALQDPNQIGIEDGMPRLQKNVRNLQ